MNVLVGYLGILYLAHPPIMGIGAYTFALLATNGTNFFVALLCGALTSTLAGLLISLPSLRLKSHYIGMATLGFLIIVNGLLINLRDVTRGALGIPGIPRPKIFGHYLGSNLEFFLFIVPITLLAGFILYRILKSPFAKVIEALREDETSAKTLGKNHIHYKIKAFLITSFFGGLFGGLLAALIGFINPHSFFIEELIILLAMVVIGGMATFEGSIIGSIIIVLLPEPLRFIDLPANVVGPIRHLLYGLLLILFMIYKPNGIMGRRTNLNK